MSLGRDMTKEEVIKVVDSLKPGDIIRIAIYDDGIGTAEVLAVTSTGLKIKVNEDLWTMCYSCTHLSSNTFCVDVDEIAEIYLKE